MARKPREARERARSERRKRQREMKKPEEESDEEVPLEVVNKTSGIQNKQKRSEVYEKHLEDKKKAKAARRRLRKKDIEEGRLDAADFVPITQEMTRERDDTAVQADQTDVLESIEHDWFEAHYRGERKPRLAITTGKSPAKQSIQFVRELRKVFPHMVSIRRNPGKPVASVIARANRAKCTFLLLVQDDGKHTDSLTVIHLPDGPTAAFRLTSFVPAEDIAGHGTPTDHAPELMLNNFTTRLGLTIGRMLGALCPPRPDFVGRRVVVFHNQRDFIFFRHMRYIFDDNGRRANLQELGPRFTLRLESLQKGAFDLQFGEYIWFLKSNMEDSRRRFFL